MPKFVDEVGVRQLIDKYEAKTAEAKGWWEHCTQPRASNYLLDQATKYHARVELGQEIVADLRRLLDTIQQSVDLNNIPIIDIKLPAGCSPDIQTAVSDQVDPRSGWVG